MNSDDLRGCELVRALNPHMLHALLKPSHALMGAWLSKKHNQVKLSDWYINFLLIPQHTYRLLLLSFLHWFAPITMTPFRFIAFR